MGFKPRTSCVESDCSTNLATTTYHKRVSALDDALKRINLKYIFKPQELIPVSLTRAMKCSENFRYPALQNSPQAPTFYVELKYSHQVTAF